MYRWYKEKFSTKEEVFFSTIRTNQGFKGHCFMNKIVKGNRVIYKAGASLEFTCDTIRIILMKDKRTKIVSEAGLKHWADSCLVDYFNIVDEELKDGKSSS